MRRPQNYGYEPVAQNQTDDLEMENERMAEELKNKISSLKSLTIDIGGVHSFGFSCSFPFNPFNAFRRRSTVPG